MLKEVILKMQDEKQFEQLILQYTQLKNGSEDIRRMIVNEDFDGAITMIKNREPLFLSCKCMRKYLELTPVQENELNTLLDKIRASEQENMRLIKNGMASVQQELKKTQQNEKIQQAYDFDEQHRGSIVNYSE